MIFMRIHSKHFINSVSYLATRRCSSNCKSGVLTTSSGNPVDSKTASLTVGQGGPILLQDFTLLDEIANFDRERIPERVVHAKGGGAFGYFEVTHDVRKYTKLSVFSKIGKRTPLAVRFSTVIGENGSSDTVRDPRGFAVKFYAEEGNWDLVGNNTPIFFMRDPILFPSFIHSQKRNPVTHLRDPDMAWDFITLRPETTHQVMFVHSDRGIPDGFRFMNGYGSHTFKLVNDRDEYFYCKFHYKTNQGIKNIPVEKASELAASDPDYSIRDLFNAIANKQFPSWAMSLQIMTEEQCEKSPFNPFDLTKVWSHKEYPLIPVGKLVLDRNPKNYFAEIEQLAFSPSHMIPGVEPSSDKVLQARLFSYSDTHRHRLGPNYLQIPVNCPYRTSVSNSQRDGPMRVNDNQGGVPNYFPNSFSGPSPTQDAAIHKFCVKGEVARWESGDEDNFSQATQFWCKTLNADERKRLVENILATLKDACGFIQERAVKNFSQVHPEFGEALSDGLRKYCKTSKPHT